MGTVNWLSVRMIYLRKSLISSPPFLVLMQKMMILPLKNFARYVILSEIDKPKEFLGQKGSMHFLRGSPRGPPGPGEGGGLIKS